MEVKILREYIKTQSHQLEARLPLAESFCRVPVPLGCLWTRCDRPQQ